MVREVGRTTKGRQIKEIRIYLEGGGDQSDGRASLRRGMGLFLEELRQQCPRTIGWNIIPSGGHGQAHKDFCNAMRTRPEALCVLLVDSEDEVRQEAAPWQHLLRRGQCAPEGADDDQCHLMVMTMESWLLADPDALESYYGKGFQRRALPTRHIVEEIPKTQVEDALKAATRNTTKGEYHKIRHGAELIGKLSPQKVRARAPHCERLFNVLGDRVSKLAR